MGWVSLTVVVITIHSTANLIERYQVASSQLKNCYPGDPESGQQPNPESDASEPEPESADCTEELGQILINTKDLNAKELDFQHCK